jgi:endonuclease YncB( thermonuclease family)
MRKISLALAWVYQRYLSNCPSRDRILRTEAIARSRRVGIWAGGHIPPWEWR